MSDELKPEERAMFDRLREEAGLPSTLEERIVASLEERGLLRRYRSRIDRRALATAVLAAGVGLSPRGRVERAPHPPRAPRVPPRLLPARSRRRSARPRGSLCPRHGPGRGTYGRPR